MLFFSCRAAGVQCIEYLVAWAHASGHFSKTKSFSYLLKERKYLFKIISDTDFVFSRAKADAVRMGGFSFGTPHCFVITITINLTFRS